MIEKTPSYYQKSKVMNGIFDAIQNESERLEHERTITENQFFVILSDRDISKHEADVGLTPDTGADIETRRGRVLSKLRGTGTVTKAMMKNVAKSFVNGDIEITEYPSEYCFSVKFTSRTGVPYNIEDIKKAIEEIKPAHLEVEYIFTYRLWQDVLDLLGTWETVDEYTWDWILSFEVPKYLYIDENNNVYFTSVENGNAIIVWDSNKAYARRV